MISSTVDFFVWLSQWVGPYHLMLHGVMLCFIVYLLVRKPYKPRSHPETLTPQEVEELIAEWTPEPMRITLSKAQKRNLKDLVISRSTSTRVTVNGIDDVLHLARCNYLGMSGHPQIDEVAEQTLRKYGVGACGPRGFYGTIDVHMFLEKRIAEFMGTEDAILYSSGYATISSAIPAFSKRGDIIICDKGVSHATQTGVTLSRSRVYWFKHNDVQDLERILKETMPKDKSELVRKFVVIEGLYFNYGDIAPLKEIMAMKDKYCFRIILDESHSVGVLGKSGRGICELLNINHQDIDILTGTLSYAFGAGGGFCCGSKQVVYHQRLNGSGYVFSASLPPFLAACAHAAIDMLDRDPAPLSHLSSNSRWLHSQLNKVPGITVSSDPASPVLHIRLAQSTSTGSRDGDEDTLEAIVDHALQRSKVLLTRAKYVESEKYMPSPSIRVCLNAVLSEQDLQTSLDAIRSAAASVLGCSRN